MANLTKTKSTCYKCNKNVFPMEKITIGDNIMHGGCFTCKTCNTKLETSNYNELSGEYYCLKDFLTVKKQETTKSPENEPKIPLKNCSFCKNDIEDNDGIVLDNEDIIHRSCFVCIDCKNPLSLGNFHVSNEKLYCSRHFGNIEGNRKKARDLLTGSLDADPLQQSLADLAEHENDLFTSDSVLLKNALENQDGNGIPNGSSHQSEVVSAPSSSDNNVDSEPSATSKEGNSPRTTTEENPSDTEYLESEEDHTQEKADTTSDRSEGAPSKYGVSKTDTGLKKKEDEVDNKTNTNTNTNAIIEKSVSSPTSGNFKDEKKKSKRKRKDQKSKKDDEGGKKKRKDKKKKSDKVGDVGEDGNDADKKEKRRKRRKDKLKDTAGDEKKKEKDNNDETNILQEDVGDKKKKTKRGLFGLKRKPSKAVLVARKESNGDGEEPTSSHPSLTSFVSSRFRKQTKKDGPQIKGGQLKDRKEISTPKLPQVQIPKPEDIEDDDTLEGLEPLTTPSKRGHNRIAKLNRSDSKTTTTTTTPKKPPAPGSTERQPSASKFARKNSSTTNNNSTLKPKEEIEEKILPISLQCPLFPDISNTLEVCCDILEEDIPLSDLNIPSPIERDDNSSFVWSNYELKREFSPLTIELPNDVLEKPKDEKERIKQSGFIQPIIKKYALIGVTRRLLQYFSILKTLFPFSTEIIGISESPKQALDLLQEYKDEKLEQYSIDNLVKQPDIDWILIGSAYNTRAKSIITALEAGKNVFCEKPVCLSIEDCIKIRDTHKKSGKKFYGGLSWRLLPFYQEIYNIIETGLLGNIVSVEVNNLLEPSEGGLLMSSSHWKEANTLLFDTFCFDIDILNWLLKSLPSKVGSLGGLNIYTKENKPKDKEEYDQYFNWKVKPLDSEKISVDPFDNQNTNISDNHAILMEYRNNTRVTCHININSAFAQKRILLCGVKGTLEGDLYSGILRFKCVGDSETTIIQLTPGLVHVGGDEQIMKELVDGVGDACFEGEELFPSIITTLGIEKAKQEQTIIDLEPNWKKLGL